MDLSFLIRGLVIVLVFRGCELAPPRYQHRLAGGPEAGPFEMFVDDVRMR